LNPIALRVLLAAIVPILIAVCYFGIVASDRYVSESSVVLRSGTPSPSNLILGGLLPVGNPDSQDVIVVSDYMLSMEMARHLDQQFALREHYADKDIDFISRLTGSSIISITTRAFEPKLAQDINREIIARSELLINRLSDRIVEDTLKQARKEVDDAVANARDVSGKLSSFTSDNNSINPGADASSISGLIGAMEAKLADTRALYTEKSAYMRESSAEVSKQNYSVSAHACRLNKVSVQR